MTKQSFVLVIYALVVTVANVYLWLGMVQGGPAPRSGRMLGLIIMLAVAAIFSDKFSRNQFAPTFIRAGSLIVMTALFFILYNR